jgi:hypothetical protein
MWQATNQNIDEHAPIESGPDKRAYRTSGVLVRHLSGYPTDQTKWNYLCADQSGNHVPPVDPRHCSFGAYLHLFPDRGQAGVTDRPVNRFSDSYAVTAFRLDKGLQVGATRR